MNQDADQIILSARPDTRTTSPSTRPANFKPNPCSTCCSCKLTTNSLIILARRLHFTLRHAIPSMTLTTASTLSGLLVNLLSFIVAVQRFALFTSLVVLLNFLFVILLVPVLLVLFESTFQTFNFFSCSYQHSNPIQKPSLVSRMFAKSVINLRFLFPLILILLTIFSVYELLIERRFDAPKGKLVSSSLLRPNHPFELFFDQSTWFWAERNLHHHNNILVINFVWGPQPQDKRSFLTYKHDSVTHQPLILDPSFNFTDPSARMWMSQFCDQLKRMPWLFTHAYSHLRHDSLASFKISTLNPTLDAPVWCPIGRFTNSIDNYVLAQSCLVQSHNCCPNGEPLEVVNSNHATFRSCLNEYLSQDMQRFPRHYGSGFRFSTTGSLDPVGLVITAFTNLSMVSTSPKVINKCMAEITDWFKILLDKAPTFVQNGFIATPGALSYEVVQNIVEHTYWSMLIAVTVASLLILISSRNLVVFVLSFVTVSSCLLFSVTLLAYLDHWTLGVVEGLVISLAAGLAIDPCIHLALAFSSIQELSSCCNRFFCLHQPVKSIYESLITLGSAITGSTWSSAIAGIPMLGCNLLCYHQVGVFMVTLMFSAWLFCYIIFAGILASFDCSNKCCPLNDQEDLPTSQKNHAILNNCATPLICQTMPSNQLNVIPDQELEAHDPIFMIRQSYRPFDS